MKLEIVTTDPALTLPKSISTDAGITLHITEGAAQLVINNQLGAEAEGEPGKINFRAMSAKEANSLNYELGDVVEDCEGDLWFRHKINGVEGWSLTGTGTPALYLAEYGPYKLMPFKYGSAEFFNHKPRLGMEVVDANGDHWFYDTETHGDQLRWHEHGALRGGELPALNEPYRFVNDKEIAEDKDAEDAPEDSQSIGAKYSGKRAKLDRATLEELAADAEDTIVKVAFAAMLGQVADADPAKGILELIAEYAERQAERYGETKSDDEGVN